MEIVNNNAALEKACNEITEYAKQPENQPHSFIAIDTEFYRDDVYYPQLCLVQIACLDKVFIIDVLSESLTDLSSFKQVLQDPALIKVFHAARQDIEVLWQKLGVTPQPIFDTQIAAMALGFGDSASYNSLTQRYLQVELDKSQQHTRWNLRPLSNAQIEYAANDVIYLNKLYPVMHRSLNRLNRLSWLQEHFDDLTDVSNYNLDPDLAWRRLYNPQDDRATFRVLFGLSQWREREAQMSNTPRVRIISDVAMQKIIRTKFRSSYELKKILPKQKYVSEILKVIDDSLKNNDIVKPIESQVNLSQDQNILYEILKVFLKIRSYKLRISEKLIVNNNDLFWLAANGGKEKSLRILSGWRREEFGEDALAICKGEKGLFWRE